MSTDGTRLIVKEYAKQYPQIRLIDNPKRIVPVAMNIGIRESIGDVIIRLDAHAQYDTNYFSSLTKALYDLDADNVGAVCITDVLNKTPKTLAIREVLSNKFGVGNSVFRTGVDEIREVDTVPFGCWRKSVFEKYGLYDERLVRNQDIELNKRILNGGGKIYIVPNTSCTYLARETYKGIAKNNFGNGKWNILTVYYTKQFRSLSLRHFIPMIFLLSLTLPILLSFIYPPFLFISIASLLSYILLFTIVSIYLSKSKGLNPLRLFITFFILHLSYGWGSIVGSWYIITKNID